MHLLSELIVVLITLKKFELNLVNDFFLLTFPITQFYCTYKKSC